MGTAKLLWSTFATIGETQIAAQPMAFMPLSLLPGGHPWQLLCPPTAVPDPTDIFNAISLAWMTDRLIPTVTNTVRKSATSCRADQRFMTLQCSH